MTSPTLSPDEMLHQAAALAAAMLRFQEPLAHLMSKHTPPGAPVVGVDCYAFVPSSRLIPRDEVASHLAALPSPAMLAPTTMRGVIGLALLDELSDERRAAMQYQLDNQSAALPEHASAPDSDRVRLEFDEETHLFALGAIRLWARRFGVLVGWNLKHCHEPTRAEWEFNLFGGDGRRYSRNLVCAVGER